MGQLNDLSSNLRKNMSVEKHSFRDKRWRRTKFRVVNKTDENHTRHRTGLRTISHLFYLIGESRNSAMRSRWKRTYRKKRANLKFGEESVHSRLAYWVDFRSIELELEVRLSIFTDTFRDCYKALTSFETHFGEHITSITMRLNKTLRTCGSNVSLSSTFSHQIERDRNPS